MAITVHDTSKRSINVGPVSVMAAPVECNVNDCAAENCPILPAIGRKKTFERDEVIFCEHEPHDSVYLILSGVVRGTKLLADGRRLVSRFVYPGQLLGYDQQQETSITAEALSTVTAIALPKSQLGRGVKDNPCLQNLLMKAVMAELNEARSQVMAVGRLTALERVAQFLYLLTHNVESDEDGATKIPMGRQDIADYLGMHHANALCIVLAQTRRYGGSCRWLYRLLLRARVAEGL